MFQLIIVTLGVLLLMFYLNSKTGKVVSITKTKEESEENDIIDLPDERAYYDETNSRIIELKKQIDETGIREDDINKINLLKKEIIEKHDEWKEVQDTLEKMTEERIQFVSEGKFYPKEYVFDINKMRMYKEKAREYQLNNPLRPFDDIYSFIKEQNEKVEEYKEIKDKIEKILAKLDIYEKSIKTKKDTITYYKKKQDLFIHLQNGKLKEAKKVLKDLKSKVKHIENE